jgi:hypothetical protein
MLSISRLTGPVACLVAACLLACGDDSGSSRVGKKVEPGERRVMPSELEKGTIVDVEVTGPGILPSGFPSDIPAYPGAEVSGGMTVPGRPALVHLESSESPDEIYEFYRTELQKNGWQVTEEEGLEHRLKAAKGDRVASVVLISRGGKTQIGIMLSAD